MGAWMVHVLRLIAISILLVATNDEPSVREEENRTTEL